MPSNVDDSIKNAYVVFSRVASIAIAIIGAIVLIGWWQDIAVFKSVLPNLVTMKANTACSFVLVGLSIYFIGGASEGSDSYFRRRIARLLPWCAGAFGFLTGMEYIFEVNLGIDELLFLDGNGGRHGINPGRMAPATALGFVLCSSALLLLSLKSNTAHLCGHALAFITGIIGFLAILGYIYGVESLYRVKLFTSVALHTALLFFFSCLAVFAATTTKGIMPTLVANDMVGIMLRRMLPAAVFLPPFLGWLRLIGQNAGYYSTNFGLALFASANVLVFLLLIVFTARSLKILSDRVHALNINLEAEVQQRTKELSVALNENQGLLDTLKKQILYSTTVLKATTEVSIIATDISGIIELFNVGAERMLGYSAEEIVNKYSPAILHNMDEMIVRGQELTHEYGTLIEGFRIFVHKPELFGAETRNWTYIRKDGCTITVSLSVTAIRDDKNQVIGYLGVAIDVTQQYLLENELRYAKQKADSASTAKSHFLANMSHEIRTPMNAILGLLQLVQQTDLNARQRDYIVKSQTAAKSLLGLLNDILDFSKVDSGKLHLDRHPFEVERLMRDLGVILSGNQGDKYVEVMFDLDPLLPPILIGDRLRLQQILINLAGNALKFTAQGNVIVKLKLLEKNAHDIRIQIAVSDTGIGISAQHIDHIFEGFVQAESSTARRFGGTGLGLAISKRLVGLMGGNLQVESEVGVGSCFWFDITLTASDLEQVSPQVINQTIAGLKILVVDDNAVSREILVRTISTLGGQADEADGGLTAIEKVRNAYTSNAPYDVVLMDWYMPDLDGLSATELICNIPTDTRQSIIIMVTAFGLEEIMARQGSKFVPFSDLLTKPVTPQQLTESLTGGRSNSQSVNPLQTQQQPLAGLHLLVVEDNELNRQVASELLAGEGAFVELAEGGLEGVAKVLDGHQSFDVVIMDVQMPDIDGMEATRRIRANVDFKALPILAMTANVSPADRAACLTAGMNDHVGKPIDMEEVIPRILALLGKQTIQQVKTHSAYVDHNSGILVDDPEVIVKRFGGKIDLYTGLFSKFYPDAARLLDTLNEQTQQKNPAAVAAALHSIKGLAATMGAKALAFKSSELEREFKSPDISPESKVLTQETINELKDLLDKSAAQLEQLVNAFEQATPSTEVVSGTLSEAEWTQELARILPMLESDNLGAIDILKKLHSKSQTHQQARLSELLTQVNALEYNLAIHTITRLLGND